MCAIRCNLNMSISSLKNCLHMLIHCRAQQLEIIISLFSLFFDDVRFESFMDTRTMSFMYDYSFHCTSQGEACLWFAASAHSRNAGKNTSNIWPGITGQTPMVSRAPQSVGFLKVLCGWVPYGLTLRYVTLNPNHLPGGPGV